MLCDDGTLSFEQRSHLRLRKPYRLILDAHLQPHLSLRLVEHDFAITNKSFSVTSIIYLSGRRHYGKRLVRRRDTRMGQEREGVPKSPGGHRRQPARGRHPGRVRRLLPVVHLPAREHRHRRRARHDMPGRRDDPLQGEPRRDGRVARLLHPGHR